LPVGPRDAGRWRREDPKPGTKETRPLGPVFQGNRGRVRDRVVQAAVVKVIEPIFERDFAATTAARRCPATAFVRVAAARTLCGESIRCSSPAIRSSWTPT